MLAVIKFLKFLGHARGPRGNKISETLVPGACPKSGFEDRFQSRSKSTVCLSLCLSLSLSVSLSVCLSVCPFVRPSVRFCFCLSVWLFFVAVSVFVCNYLHLSVLVPYGCDCKISEIFRTCLWSSW